MPGWGEGFGIVYLEAMACGIPVVASKLDASREAVLDGELGIIVDPKNPKEVRNGILAALERGNRGVPKGVEYFSTKNFQQRVRGILQKLTPDIQEPAPSQPSQVLASDL
jgi:glycosyltransferase involved in cell wall biosynthesis